MRVMLLDPAAFTTPYDHHLAEALAAGGAEVELVTSRFRFGQGYAPSGYRRTELFYPLSTRIFGRSPARLPLKAVEHLVGLGRLRRAEPDVLHAQWVPWPGADGRLLRLDGPSILTAHDILPRRSGRRRALWRRTYDRFDRVVAHSQRGKQRLEEELGIDAHKVKVIPHPVFPGPLRRADDGATIVFLGVIRPYKQIDHVIDAARLLGARLLVIGDPAMDLGDRVEAAGTEWRLGYRPHDEVDQALAESTVAAFAYRDELDQSGALLRALGAGVPAVAYDVGGVAEPIRRFGAGAVVPPDDQAALRHALGRLLDDDQALARARAGAERARRELTWDVSARSHLALYRELL